MHTFEAFPYIYFYMSNSNYLFSLFSYLSSATTFIPFIIAFTKRGFLPKEFKVLWLLLSISILTDFLGYVFTFLLKISNLQLFNLFTLLELVLLSFMYYVIISIKIWKYLIISFVIIFMLYGLFFVDIWNIKTLNSALLTAESIFITFLSIHGFHHLLKHSENINILSVPFFWINTALIFYFVGNLFLHLFSTILQEHALYTFYELWGLWHSSLNIIFYILISIGFWQIKRT